jgi:3-mercaptopyruvate sulfurtransferase SseA
LVLIALGAIALGVIINVARPHPLGRNYKDPASRLVARSQDKGPAIVLIGFDEMRANIGDAEKLIVDARPAIFFRFGYIPTAVNLPRDEFEKYLPQVRERLGDSLIRQTVIYCAGGDCEDSTLVAERLMAVGVKAIAIYQGGWDEWSAKASSP